MRLVTLTPTTAAPGVSITASGRAARKRSTRIRVDGTLVLSFTTGGSGTYTRTIVVPSRVDGSYAVVLEQLTDAWRQVDHATLTVKNPIVVPPPPPPPPTGTVGRQWIDTQTDATYGPLDVQSTTHGVELQNCTRVVVQDTVAHDCADGGFREYGLTGNVFRRVKAQRNGKVGSAMNGDGFLLKGAGTLLEDFESDDNGFPDPANLFDHGVYLALEARDYVVRRGKLRRNVASGIKASGTGTIEDVLIEGPTRAGIVFSGDAPGKVSIRRATITGCQYTILVVADALLSRFDSDYNVFEPGAVFNLNGQDLTLAQWRVATGQDMHSTDGTVVVPPPPPPPPPTGTVTVNSIASLYSALGNNEPDITLAPGTYSGDLVIDSRFAPRTNPGIIHCDGVTLQGYLRHRGGAHHLDWQGGIAFANLTVSQTGVMVFGGYAGEPGPHHITIRKPKVLGSVKRAGLTSTTEHAIYFSYATGDWGDILIEDLDVDATDPAGLATAIHADHGYAADAPNVTARRVTLRRTVFRGNGTAGSSVQAPLILWQPPYHDWTFDGATITNANGNAVRFESKGASNVVFRNVVSTGSRNAGFYSSMGANPPGVTFDGCSFG